MSAVPVRRTLKSRGENAEVSASIASASVSTDDTRPTGPGDAAHDVYVDEWERMHPGQRFPQPWQREEDADGWSTTARGRNWPARPDVDMDLSVALPPDDYVWLARQARQANLRPSEYIAILIRDARTAV